MEQHSRQKRFYDQGWNDYLKGVPFDHNAFRDWRDGWQDCEQAEPKDQQPME